MMQKERGDLINLCPYGGRKRWSLMKGMVFERTGKNGFVLFAVKAVNKVHSMRTGVYQ